MLYSQQPQREFQNAGQKVLCLEPLIPKQEPDYIVEGYLKSYFKRLWNNESGCMELYEEGFERAYNERLDRQNNEYLLDINNVAVLGGHYDQSKLDICLMYSVIE